jgi:excinuclease ABC subunit A
VESEFIEVRGARVHNLRNVSLRLPRNSLVCFTGVSGSGKSSLAFDTLYAEGQRRYVESLSSYARQFLGQIEKPDCDSIEGLSPSIAIQQKTAGQNPRSTVGTMTAVYDFLRVLYASVGVQHCERCGQAISAQTREQIVTGIINQLDGRRVLVLAPVARGQKGEFRDLFAELLRAGYIRARVDGSVIELRDEIALEKNKRHHIEVVVDRLVVGAEHRARVAEAVEAALRLGAGTMIASAVEKGEPGGDGGDSGGVKRRTGRMPMPRGDERTGGTAVPRGEELLFSSHYACANCNLSYEQPSPQLFSFNSPTGMCMHCDGLGETFEFDPDLLIPDDSKSFLSPCVEPLRRPPGKWRRHIYQGVADFLGIDLKTPWKDLSKMARDALLFGTGDQHITFTWRWSGGNWKHGDTFGGVVGELQEKYRKANAKMVRDYYEKYMRRGACRFCGGERLNAQARGVRLRCVLKEEGARGDSRTSDDTARSSVPHPKGWGTGGEGTRKDSRTSMGTSIGPSLTELCALPVARACEVMDSLVLTDVERQVAGEALKEIRARLSFLIDVGLHYLALDRTAPTLSGGEAQRIRLAGQIGSGLAGVLYVLDEPSIGLHPRDNLRLLESLKALRDLGNTVLVVEHDEETMREADYVVDFGPGPGVRGGHVVAEGPLEAVLEKEESLTGQYLRGDRRIEVPLKRRVVDVGTREVRKTPVTKRAVTRTGARSRSDQSSTPRGGARAKKK